MKRHDAGSSSTIRTGSAAMPMGYGDGARGVPGGRSGKGLEIEPLPAPWIEAACPACGKRSRLLSRGARWQTVGLKHPVERAPVDAQHRRGVAHVASALLEHL